MNKFGAKSKMKKYLKSHFIKFYEDIYDGTDRFTMLYKGYEKSPDKVIESCIYFYEDVMECRVYYTATGAKWCENSKNLSEFMRLLNYINARVWPCGSDGIGGTLYIASHLYAPRLYMTEDSCYDITMTTIIPYDFYEVAPLETEDFLTACCPELMDALSPTIFMLLLGTLSLDDAIQAINKDILGEE